MPKKPVKNGRAGIFLGTIMRKHNLKTPGDLGACLGLNTTCIQSMLCSDKIPLFIEKMLYAKWNVVIPSTLSESPVETEKSEEKAEAEDKESDLDASGRGPPIQKILWIFDRFVSEHQEWIDEVFCPSKIVQDRGSTWGKELRKRRSRVINSMIFHLPTIKAAYLLNQTTIKQHFPRQTIKNLIDGIPMEDQVYLKFSRITRIPIRELLTPVLQTLFDRVQSKECQLSRL
jgi:hypothetical protein